MEQSRKKINLNFCYRTCIVVFILCFALPISSFALSPYSNKELDELEKEFIQLINQSDSIERNPLANYYINTIGTKLAAYAKIPLPYFFIVKSNEINAFAGPGGYIGINTQLILSTSNESELAAVMAHEIAHVRLHHLYQMIEHQKEMRIPMLASLLAAAALGVVNPTLGSGAMLASMGGFAQNNINFTRAHEKEADRIGINMLKQAGFNARGMASFFRKMQESSRYYYTANVPAILRTHPLDEYRIAEAESRIGAQSSNYFDSADYPLFKELIRNQVASDSHQLIEFYKKECLRHSTIQACTYGWALALTNLDQYKAAEEKLNSISANNPNNLFFEIALANAELGNKDFQAAIPRLQLLHSSYPDNYAALMAYAHGLLTTGQTTKAVDVLLKGSRKFKRDLPLCEQLAQAQAEAKQKAYAYFTESQCQLLQGRHRDALRQLAVVKTMTKNDPYLSARADAMIEEIKFRMAD